MGTQTVNSHFDSCLLGPRAVAEWYDRVVADGLIVADESQRALALTLQDFSDEVLAAEKAGGGKNWSSFFRRGQRRGKGVYIHGGVGRGKTFLMDGFYLQLPLEKKRRVHFHQFMQRLHHRLKAREDADDALADEAQSLLERFDLICFDEFHVSDITDAMLLGRLLQILLSGGMHFILTSNYAPDALYPNGLGRDRFLPTIALIKDALEVFSLDSGVDYRRRVHDKHPLYFSPCDEQQLARARDFFNELSGGIIMSDNIRLSGREVVTERCSSDCIWFDFASLCVSARNQADYLQLAERYSTVFLSQVPRLDDDNLFEARRRFTWLVDILYDHKNRLVLIADAPLESLYGDGEGGESGRTLSRLSEMQRGDFLSDV